MYPNSKHNLILLMLKKFNCKILTKIDISWYMAKLLNRSLLSKLGQIRTFVFGYFSFNNEIAAFAVKVQFIFVLPQTGQNLVLLHVIIVTVCLKLTGAMSMHGQWAWSFQGHTTNSPYIYFKSTFIGELVLDLQVHGSQIPSSHKYISVHM